MFLTTDDGSIGAKVISRIEAPMERQGRTFCRVHYRYGSEVHITRADADTVEDFLADQVHRVL